MRFYVLTGNFYCHCGVCRSTGTKHPVQIGDEVDVQEQGLTAKAYVDTTAG